MKNITLLKGLSFLFVLTFSLNAFSQSNDGKKRMLFGKEVKSENILQSGHIRCATMENEQFLRSQNSKMETREQFEKWIAQKIEERKSLESVASQSGGIIYIPVVVHVIHNGDAYGVEENITDEQVQSQITVMTQDYRKMTGTPGFNTNPVGADIQVEFVLAKVDPNGNPTNGINRINLCQDSWSTSDINTIVKPSTYWNPADYMNMWSVKFSDGQLLGYAQFPQTSLSGMSNATQDASTDGVVAGYRFFGSSDLATGNFSAPYDKGRTMTHEVGHFLGLLHTFQGGCSNAAGDYCLDTPAVATSNGGCPVGTNSCTALVGNDMIENYMDYTDDSCMNIFTTNQKDRITTVMNNSPRRSTLKTSVKDQAIPLFANDAEIKIEAYCSNTAANPCTPANQHQVYLYNRGNTNLTAASITYNVNGGANSTINWTGNLASNKYELVSFTTTQASGTLNVAVATANGGADQRATNNTDSEVFAFSDPIVPTNYDYTAYVFNFQGDRWGTETTWNIKNAQGAILYSGGPYTNLPSGQTPAPIVQNWNLPANNCYTFTILDSYGDGISPGNYTIKTNNGATTVASGGDFLTSESNSFTNTSLSTLNFDIMEGIYVYPNPSKDFINISLPNDLDSIDSFVIYNTIGQKIYQQKVATEADLTVSTASFSKGVYIITVEKDNEKKSIQFIKE